MVGLYENLHLETISCASFADGQTFVTGGTDAVIFCYLSNVVDAKTHTYVKCSILV